MPLLSLSDIQSLSGMTAEKDLPVISSALDGQTDVLVTGDKKDFLKIKREAMLFIIHSPAEFINKFLLNFLKGCKKDC